MDWIGSVCSNCNRQIEAFAHLRLRFLHIVLCSIQLELRAPISSRDGSAGRLVMCWQDRVPRTTLHLSRPRAWLHLLARQPYLQHFPQRGAFVVPQWNSSPRLFAALYSRLRNYTITACSEAHSLSIVALLGSHQHSTIALLNFWFDLQFDFAELFLRLCD